MKPRHTRDDTTQTIRAAFPEDACSVEWRDHDYMLSVRVYGPNGEVVVSAEMPRQEICKPKTLASRIADWQRRRRLRLGLKS